MRRTWVVVFALAAGCGGRQFPVTGAVSLDDGTPVTKGMVVFERFGDGEPLSARGEIKPDGRYELSTTTIGDGVPPGKYRVLINSLDLSDVPDEKKKLPYDFRYLKFATSGLECEVKAGPTDFPIRLDRAKKR